ncbi:MAG: alginate export family protein [Candidatus Omnitrophica bacterium]|nr:alginate export family protein [Candidatus Omnitrophota bacterium]
MGKKLFLLAAILSVALVVPAFAAVENIKVSGDITSQGILRDLSMGDDLKLNTIMDAEAALATQTRLRLDADLTENVSAVVRLINERLWGTEDEQDTEIDLDLAYVEMKEFLYQPLSLTVGRQLLRYGNGLIVGDPDTNQTAVAKVPTLMRDLSMRKSFDAIKAVLDFSPFTYDMIYAKIREGTTWIGDDSTLFGVNAAYQWGSFNGITEGYFFGAHNNKDGNNNLVTTQVNENQATTYVIGGRIQFDPIEKLMLGLEGAYQFGDVLTPMLSDGSTPVDDDLAASPSEYRHLSAFAIQAAAEYKLMTKYDPKIGIRYSYLSGDDDNNLDDEGDFTGWDPMFEDQTAGEIINILFPNTNSSTAMIYGSIMPREDITLGLAYINTRLAQNYIYLNTYSSARGPAIANAYRVNRDDKLLGSEIDAYALYDYTEDVQIKLTGAWFMPGSNFFEDHNNDIAYSLRAGLAVNF